MEDFIYLIVLFIVFVLVVNTSLHIWLGKKRNKDVLSELKKVLSGINSISGNVLNNEKSAVSRDNSLRSLISKNQQRIENTITQASKNSDGRFNYLEERVIGEVQSATNVIQNSIQHSHSGLSKSFKSKLSDIEAELTEINQNLREFKDEILRTQAQSFSSIETKVNVARNEEHRFIEQQFISVNKEQTNIGKCVQEVTKNMNNHFTSIKPLEELLGRLNTLYNKLISLDKDILGQEKSLNGMVEKHTKILEYTQDLQKTSEEIFDMMKLMLMDTVVRQTTPRK